VFSKISKYWSREAKEYNKSTQAEFRDQKSINAWKELLKEALGESISLNILDVGTGTGFLAILLSEMGHRVVAVDAAQGMLEHASKNATRRGVKIEFRLSDAANLNLASNSFDVVISRHVVWTLSDPERAYAEWWRVLRPGGKLVVIDGNFYLSLRSPFRKAWRLFAWLLIYLSEGRKPWKRHRKEEFINKLPLIDRIRPEEDQKLLKACGYNIVTINPNIYPKVRSLFAYLKTGFWGAVFMIVAEKPLKL